MLPPPMNAKVVMSSSTWTEEGRSYPNQVGAFRDGEREVVGHAHRQGIDVGMALLQGIEQDAHAAERGPALCRVFGGLRYRHQATKAKPRLMN